MVCKETAFVSHVYYINISSYYVAENVDRGIPKITLYTSEKIILLFRYKNHIYFLEIVF